MLSAQGSQRTRRPRVDPTAWANRRKEAMERAKTSRKVAEKSLTRPERVHHQHHHQHRNQHQYHHSNHPESRPLHQHDHGSDVNPPPSRSSESYVSDRSSGGGSAHRYAEEHLQQQQYQRRQIPQPQQTMGEQVRRTEGRGRGRGRGRRASMGLGSDALASRQQLNVPHYHNNTTLRQVQQRQEDRHHDVRRHPNINEMVRTPNVFSETDLDTVSHYSGRSSHRHMQSLAGNSSHQDHGDPGASYVPNASSAFGETGNKLSLLKQRMLERKKHRRRRTQARSRSNGNDQLLEMSADPGSHPLMSTQDQYHHHTQRHQWQGHRHQGHVDPMGDAPQNSLKSNTGFDQHEQNDIRGEDEVSMSSAAFHQYQHQHQNHHHHLRPHQINSTQYRHEDKPVGPSSSTGVRRRDLNWDEQPVGPTRNSAGDPYAEIPNVQPYIYDHRMYDESQHQSPFSGSGKQHRRKYVWEEDGMDAHRSSSRTEDKYGTSTRSRQPQPQIEQAASPTKAAQLMNWDEQPVGKKLSVGPEDERAEIEMRYCKNCDRSFALPTYEKFHGLDNNGMPKCAKYNKQRKVYNSAKTRIKNNTAMSEDDKRALVNGRKSVVKDMRKRKEGKHRRRKHEKWKEESKQFREAMRLNRQYSSQR